MPHFSADKPETLLSDVLQAFQEAPELVETCGQPENVVLQAGLTNRVFRVETASGDFFVRLPRAETAGMVDRKAEEINLKEAARLGLAVPPLYCNPKTGVLVTRAVADLVTASENLPELLGAAIGRLHASGAAFAGHLNADEVYFAQRDVLSVKPEIWNEMAELDQVLRNVRTRQHAWPAADLVASHGDLSPGNCLATARKVWLIDWEYSGMADPAWDLAYAVLEHDFCKAREVQFLTAYRESGGAAFCPHFEQLEVMKAKCDAVSALWALEQLIKGREETTFLPFARERIERALARLRELDVRPSERPAF